MTITGQGSQVSKILAVCGVKFDVLPNKIHIPGMSPKSSMSLLFLVTVVSLNVVHFGLCATNPVFLPLLETPSKLKFWNCM